MLVGMNFIQPEFLYFTFFQQFRRVFGPACRPGPDRSECMFDEKRKPGAAACWWLVLFLELVPFRGCFEGKLKGNQSQMKEIPVSREAHVSAVGQVDSIDTGCDRQGSPHFPWWNFQHLSDANFKRASFNCSDVLSAEMQGTPDPSASYMEVPMIKAGNGRAVSVYRKPTHLIPCRAPKPLDPSMYISITCWRDDVGHTKRP